jgi:hypothetical protein
MSEEQHPTATSAKAAAKADYIATMREIAAMYEQADNQETVLSGLPVVPRWLLKRLHLA